MRPFKKKPHRPFIKEDKLGRICSIYWLDQNSQTTPEEFKEALNMFRGRQLKSNFTECHEYIRLSLAKQAGDLEAEKKLNQIHHSWNNAQEIRPE